MANSPVVINSSSPPPFRLPSATPPQVPVPNAAAADSSTTSSSSPGLPSPSTFFTKPAAGLQTTKQSQQNAPPGITSGFRSAANVATWNYFGDPSMSADVPLSGRQDETTGDQAPGSSNGTAEQIRELPVVGEAAAEQHGETTRSPVRTCVSHDPSVERVESVVSRSPAVGGISRLAGDLPRQARARSRTPSVSLSVYSFDGGFEAESPAPPLVAGDANPSMGKPWGSPGVSHDPVSFSVSEYGLRSGQQEAVEAAAAIVEPVKKMRKQALKRTDCDGAEPAKQPKKRAPKAKAAGDAPEGKRPRRSVAKSASFVLNSDDLASTQFAGLDAAQVQGSRPLDNDAFRLDIAPAQKAKRAPRKPKKSNDISTGVDSVSTKKVTNKTGKESAYFTKPPETGDDSAIDLSMTVEVQDPAENMSGTPIQAQQRRRSWTPANNTTSAVTARPETPASTKSADNEGPALSLAAVLGDLAYAKQAPPVLQRTASGEALLKRRRIELADEATVAPKAKKVSEPAKANPLEKAKKVKAPKKKPQTITELATKAYRVEDTPQAAQATVSSFFAAQKLDVDENLSANHAEEAPTKVKKPRKPREKKIGDTAKLDKPKKDGKPKAKAKVRFNEDDLFGALYAPEQARLEEGRQDFLFGTSSQIGAEESPTFIRQMQVAMTESEVTATAQHPSSPSGKSYMRVPTAPHGTNLSCGQGTRELWCSAARDGQNAVLIADDNEATRRASAYHGPRHVVIERQTTEVQAEPVRSEERSGSSAPMSPALPKPPSTVDSGELTTRTDRVVVDLCFTSPVVAAQDADSALAVHPLPEQPSGDTPPGTRAMDQPQRSCSRPRCADPASDDWVILGDSSPEVPLSRRKLTEALSLKPLPQLKRTVTSPLRNRSALRTLDANVYPCVYTSPHRAFLHTQNATATTSPAQKRPRGRAAKEAATAADGVVAHKRRTGRPPKGNSGTESQPLPQLSRPSPSKTYSASQPVHSSDFVNIDEISDSDCPKTPSPPRRRATSTPPTIRPLDLEIVASPSVKARSKSKKTEPKDTTTPAAAWSKLKPEAATWINITPTLFPQITATIKSTAPSTDLAKPTWYEKILLYDPIVLEDLTAWLNDHGIRVETTRLKPKAKVKARRKKKDAPELEILGEVEREELVPDEYYETVQEPLKPWMVQKWCEDKSVCCLWREGLRGGVRTRY